MLLKAPHWNVNPQPFSWWFSSEIWRIKYWFYVFFTLLWGHNSYPPHSSHWSEHCNSGTTYTCHLLCFWNTYNTCTSCVISFSMQVTVLICPAGHIFMYNYLLISESWHGAFLFSHRGQHLYNTAWCSCTFPLKYKNKSHLMVQFKPGTFYMFLTSRVTLLFNKCTEARNTHTHIHAERHTHPCTSVIVRTFVGILYCICPYPNCNHPI